MQTQSSAKQTATTPLQAQVIFGKSVALSGVSSLVRSDDKKVVADAKDRVVTVEGDSLVVESLDADEGAALIVGNVKSVRTTAGKDVRGALAKLFK